MTHSDFATAYEKGFSSTVRLLLAVGVHPDKVADVAQAAWVRGWEKRDQLVEPGKLLSWIARIGLNLFRNELRRPMATDEVVDLSCRPATSPTTIDVRARLRRCPPDERRLLESYYLEGYTSAELGRLNHCTSGAIRVRVLRAKKRFLNSELALFPS